MNTTDSKQPEPSNEAEREAGFAGAHGSAHYAIVLQPGLIPIKKRLPLYAADQVPILRELQRLHPNALMAVVDACGAEIAVWHPKDVEAMAACAPNDALCESAGRKKTHESGRDVAAPSDSQQQMAMPPSVGNAHNNTKNQ